MQYKNREIMKVLKKYQDEIYKVCFSQLRNEEDVKEAVQLTALKITEFIERISQIEEYRLGAYICKIAKNCAIDVIYRYHRNEELLLLDNDEDIVMIDNKSNSDMIQESTNAIFMEQLMEDFSEKDKEILKLRFGYDLPSKEVAKIVGMTDEAVRQRIVRLKQKLRERIDRGQSNE